MAIRVFFLFVASVAASVCYADGTPNPEESGGNVAPVMVPASPSAMKRLTELSSRAPAGDGLRASYVGPCGGAYICFDDSVIHCGGGGRPYESVSDQECYCWRDNCP